MSAKTRKTVHVPDPHSLQRLKAIVDECWACAGDQNLSIPDWADAAGLAYTTIWKLANGDTSFPRFQTIAMMARAVGLDVVVDVQRTKKKGRAA